ncbi:MAG: hypothetical protein HOD60_10610 [Candidatus Nitrosopelagicus sp.]|nr:hypothetical protein [Candidatus Nitrosopelagicus sp.]
MSHVENKIGELLKKHGRMRHSELKKIVVEQEKMCAKRTFDKTLERMNDSAKIFRNQTAKQVVYYELSDFSFKQDNANKFFELQLKTSKQSLDKFLQYESELTDEQKAEFIFHLYGCIDYLKQMNLLLEALKGSKKSKIISDKIKKDIKDFSIQVTKKCESMMLDVNVNSIIMTKKGREFSFGLARTHKIIDSLQEIKVN